MREAYIRVKTHLSIFATTKKILLRTCMRFIPFSSCSVATHHKPRNGGIFFPLWFTAILRSCRAVPISKKIAQQKWTPFRLTEGERGKEEEGWPVYMANTQPFVPFLFIL